MSRDPESRHAPRVTPAAAGASRRVRLVAVAEDAQERDDLVAVEEPLEIRIVSEQAGAPSTDRLVVTMRSPGHDLELAAGFVLAEGIVETADEIWRIDHCSETLHPGNVVDVHLRPGVAFDSAEHRRNAISSSSCGVCAKESIEQVLRGVEPRPLAGESGFELDGALLHALPERLLETQGVFARTGGLHACGVFDASGYLEVLREDVGRHNAVDKVVGNLLLAGEIPASDRMLVVSGRAGFELVQKAVRAGAEALLSVSAPSSLAIETAAACGLILVGFLRDGRFNVYTGSERVRGL